MYDKIFHKNIRKLKGYQWKEKAHNLGIILLICPVNLLTINFVHKAAILSDFIALLISLQFERMSN